MNIKAKSKRLFETVRDVIHRWDPYSLLAGGAPPDEFDSEIASVVSQIPRIRSATDAVHAVSRVFSSAFQREGFGPLDCAEVGANLFEALQRDGLVEVSEN